MHRFKLSIPTLLVPLLALTISCQKGGGKGVEIKPKECQPSASNNCDKQSSGAIDQGSNSTTAPGGTRDQEQISTSQPAPSSSEPSKAGETPAASGDLGNTADGRSPSGTGSGADPSIGGPSESMGSGASTMGGDPVSTGMADSRNPLNSRSASTTDPNAVSVEVRALASYDGQNYPRVLARFAPLAGPMGPIFAKFENAGLDPNNGPNSRGGSFNSSGGFGSPSFDSISSDTSVSGSFGTSNNSILGSNSMNLIFRVRLSFNYRGRECGDSFDVYVTPKVYQITCR